jgi:cytoskeleton protein RodZ
VAVTLKVPVARLEALESGRYHELPDPTFVRALAKSVCKVIKVDPEPILASLPSAYVANLGPTATAISEPMPLSRAGNMMSSSEPMVRVPSAVLVAAGLMILATALWVWLPERSVVETVEPVLAPISTPVQSEASQSTEVAQANSTETLSSTPPAVEAVANPAGAAVEVTPNVVPQLAEGVVQVVALDTAWIEVIGASGRVLMQRSLEPQETVAFSRDLPLSMVIGRADQVKVVVRGQALELQTWTRSNVARFEVR